MRFIQAFLFSALFMTMSYASSNTREGFYVFDAGKKLMKIFTAQKLTIDHVGSHGYEVYGPKGTKEFLSTLTNDFLEIPQEPFFYKARPYPSPEEVAQRIKKVVDQNPDIMKMFSIGESREGRKLWVVKVSDNVHEDETEPEFKYIANMHGNEIVGREMMAFLLEDMGKNYKTDPKVKELIDNTEIFIMPTMNPDGSAKRRRGNANWTDLNRDFPDFTTQDNRNNPRGREPETKAIMSFQAERKFALSANFHGGTKCVNYPWDTSPDDAPLTEFIVELSLEYALGVPGMHDNPEFENGIVNGYQWYEVNGGMQDWSYRWYDDLQITIELSHNKWPDYESNKQYFLDNKESLYTFMKRVHQGAGFSLNSEVKGEVLISKDGIKIGKYGFDKGEYYKVLPTGDYVFEITTQEGKKTTFRQSVTNEIAKENGRFTSLTL